LDSIQIEGLLTRIDNLEKRHLQEFVTLLEIMSNVTFFGGIKKANCKYARNDQCSLFHLQSNGKNKIPMATECGISGCNSPNDHLHLELSNVTCTFCPHYINQIIPDKNIRISSRRKNKRQKEQTSSEY
jgi:hypothetical protein